MASNVPSTYILEGLNASQRAAVSSSAQTLAILAGPGSGKTHTLTSRVAWFLKQENYQPWNIIVATFTVKAAREMKERIGKLIGDGMEDKLILGTFHSISRRYLVRYGHLIGIPKDFGIADTADSKAIVKRIVKRHNLTIDAAQARNRISTKKSKGSEWKAGEMIGKQSAEAIAKELDSREFELVFQEYEAALARSKMLDYDDLLLRCADLLRQHPSCVSNVESVLIDEFQDTNLVQFDLMRLFAAQRKRVTIVGDPDQSIYGWRSAETKNFRSMIRQYPDTVTIPLEENYRSSGSILIAALEVIRQDTTRIEKSLLATHAVGCQPVLRLLPTAHIEAQWIVQEIKRTLALTGNLMDFNDVAILLRSANLSRSIESALGKAGIPYRMVGGHKFWDRVEVKLIIDYLKVINQPHNNDAVDRTINTPKRGIGELTMKSLLEEAEQSGISLWTLVLDIAQGNILQKTSISKSAESGMSAFVNVVLTARKKMAENAALHSPIALIEYVIKKLNFEEYLQKTYPEDHETRMANVQELLGMAADFSAQDNVDGDDDALPSIEGLEQQSLSQPITLFLANVALATDMTTDEDRDTPRDQVTISTIHAAKGLEWPVVFIPAAYAGSIPHSRAEDSDEERRLLYVAMTRAKALLYISSPLKSSNKEHTTLSPFLSPQSLAPYFDKRGPTFMSSLTQAVAQILRRPNPTYFDREGAIEALVSNEDNVFPVDGEDVEAPEKQRDNWDGHHYSEGQQVLKKQRTKPSTTEAVSARPAWKRGYSTTMEQAASFTVTALQQPGFISVRENMEVFEQQSSRGAELHKKQSDLNSKKRVLPDAPKKKKPASTQHSIANFFGGKKETAIPGVISCIPTSRKVRDVLGNDHAHSENHKKITPPFELVPQATAQHLPAIVPTASTHRLGSLPLPHSTKRWIENNEECTSKRPYMFISSSPQYAQEAGPQETTESMTSRRIDTSATVSEPEPEVSIQSTPMNVMKPAKTFHVTTAARLNTLGGPPQSSKKTLGIGKRSMTGWADRMNRN